MLYKILDLFTNCQIKVVFLATSQKLDVADSFEKRIKSRFSHKSVMLYDQSLQLFIEQVCALINDKLNEILAKGEQT